MGNTPFLCSPTLLARLNMRDSASDSMPPEGVEAGTGIQ
jgi:hypothetical protein